MSQTNGFLRQVDEAESETLKRITTAWRNSAFGLDLIDGICMACSHKMGTQEAAKTLGLRLLSAMSGHRGIARYRMEWYEILTF